MSRVVRQEQLGRYRVRYQGRGKEGKGVLLDEVCEQYGYERKYAIKLLNSTSNKTKHTVCKMGRPCVYGQEAVLALKTIWLCAEQPCGKRLRGMLCEWLQHYPQPLSEHTCKQLANVSASQIDRLLAPHRAHNPKRLCGTRSGTLLKHQIPIKTEHWDVSKPGYVEIDTVAHCGESMQGDFIWSLVLTDICTGWTAIRAVWNKGSHGILHALQEMEQELPFELLGVDSDNGSEFLNHHLYGYLKQKHIAFTRSRPYRKNDNAHIEQKNWTHARQLLGYQRMDNPEQVKSINKLYGTWQDFQNHWCSNMKLKAKERRGSRIHKSYHPASTAYSKLLPYLSQSQKEQFENYHNTLNPFLLKASIEQGLRRVHKQAHRSSRPTDSLHSVPAYAILQPHQPVLT